MFVGDPFSILPDVSIPTLEAHSQAGSAMSPDIQHGLSAIFGSRASRTVRCTQSCAVSGQQSQVRQRRRREGGGGWLRPGSLNCPTMGPSLPWLCTHVVQVAATQKIPNRY